MSLGLERIRGRKFFGHATRDVGSHPAGAVIDGLLERTDVIERPDVDDQLSFVHVFAPNAVAAAVANNPANNENLCVFISENYPHSEDALPSLTCTYYNILPL